MGVTAEPRCRRFFRGQSAADFVSSLKYADAHAGISGQVHGENQRFVATTAQDRIKSKVSHCSSFRGRTAERCAHVCYSESTVLMLSLQRS